MYCHLVTAWSQCTLQYQGRTLVSYSTAIALVLVNLANASLNGPDTFELVVAFQAPWNASYPHGSPEAGLSYPDCRQQSFQTSRL